MPPVIVKDPVFKSRSLAEMVNRPCSTVVPPEKSLLCRSVTVPVPDLTNAAVPEGLSLLRGGGQEGGRRAGTENVPGIVGLGVAAALAGVALPVEMPRITGLRDEFESGVRTCFPDARFHGNPSYRLPNTTNFALPGLDAQGLLAGLDRLGVACSIGSACTSGEVDASHVLRAMGVGDEEARSSLRFSFSRMSTAEEVPAALAALGQASARHRRDGLGH